MELTFERAYPSLMSLPRLNYGDDRKRPKGSKLLPLAPADEVIQ
jgi:hypothetical protein